MEFYHHFQDLGPGELLAYLLAYLLSTFFLSKNSDSITN